MAAVLEGKVDAVLLTGGMAHSERLVERLRGYVEWIAPVAVYPGEDELRALAEGVFRVLDGEEEAKRMGRGARNAAELVEARELRERRTRERLADARARLEAGNGES